MMLWPLLWLALGAQSPVPAAPAAPGSAPAPALQEPMTAAFVSLPPMGEGRGALPPLVLPPIGRDLLVLRSHYQFAVATGRAPELGLSSAPWGVETHQGQARFVLPVIGSGAYQYLHEGRRRAYGAQLSVDLGASVQGQRSSSLGHAHLRLARAQIFGRHYFTASVATPWYAELTTGVPGASYNLVWAGRSSSQNGLYAPLRVEAAVGRGRIIPIEPRLRLQKLAQMLKQQGAITQDIPPEVARKILLVWWALRHERGYAQRLARTLEVLAEAGLLICEVNQQAVYAFGQIFTDSALVARWEGANTRLAARYGATWGEAPRVLGLTPTRSTVVLQAGHRQVINRGYDTSWSVEGLLSFAPRRADRLDTVLHLAWSGPPPALEQARVALAMPITYQRYLYDTAYNVRGLLALRARLGAGYDVPSAKRTRAGYVNTMAGLGAEAAWYQGRAMGLSAGADVDLGHAFGRLGFVVGVFLRAEYGHLEALRVGPEATPDL